MSTKSRKIHRSTKPLPVLTPMHLATVTERLQILFEAYTRYFRTKTRSCEKQAQNYITGKILEKGRGSMTSYEKIVPGCNSQNLQHFISNSPWDERPVIGQIQKDVSQEIGDPNNGSLHVDGVGFHKSGKHSVGVKRQYNGRYGKRDNCQVGVFLGYVNNPYRTLIDERLYLPEDWANDPIRREKCGVPEEIDFKTKIELAWDMIMEAEERGVPFGWIGMDCLYGRAVEFRAQIDTEGMVYVADIPKNTKVRLAHPIEVMGEDRGQIQVQALRSHLDSCSSFSYNRVYMRDTERKELYASMACLHVIPNSANDPNDEVWLLIRKDEGSNEVKSQLTNAPLDTPLERLGKMSCSRYWIERAIQDGKSDAGLADFQVRSWRAWHHHMALTFLAMYYLLTLCVELGANAPLLTVQDTKEILAYILPRKEYGDEDIIDLITAKHKARYSARMSHHRRNKGPPL